MQGNMLRLYLRASNLNQPQKFVILEKIYGDHLTFSTNLGIATITLPSLHQCLFNENCIHVEIAS